MPTAPAPSAAFYRFFAVAAILWLFVLITGNNVHPVWLAGERLLLDGPPKGLLPGWLVRWAAVTLDGDLFGLRLIGTTLLLITLSLTYRFGRQLFGYRTLLVTLLVLVSSLLINTAGKFVLADNFLFLFQGGFGLAVIYYLKTGKAAWLLVLFGALALLSHPLSSFLYAVVLLGGLGGWHPQGRRLRAYAWLPLLGLLGGWWNDWQLLPPGYELSYGYQAYGRAWGLQLLGLFPWLGFLLAALWNVPQKVRRGEELNLILGLWLLAAAAGGGLVVQLVAALLIARQANDFFRPNYPYKPLVIFGSIAQLLGFFFLAMSLMMTGFRELGGTGFRVGMVLGLVYWAPGVFGVVGLWSKGPKLLLGGRVLSGLLVMLVGWLLLYPLVAQGLGK